MNYNLLTYGSYLLITLFVILYVGSTLYKNGRPFLVNVFTGDITLADAINKILIAGFYLMNIGYTVVALKIWKPVTTCIEMLNAVGWKAGLILLALGIMHFFNVITLIAIGKNRKHHSVLTN